MRRIQIFGAAEVEDIQGGGGECRKDFYYVPSEALVATGLRSGIPVFPVQVLPSTATNAERSKKRPL